MRAIITRHSAAIDLNDQALEFMAQVTHGRDARHARTTLQGVQLPLQFRDSILVLAIAMIAVRASDGAALTTALAAVDTALSNRRVASQVAGAQPPRTTAAAVRASGPGLALISVPGRYAFAEAMDALEAGCDVMIFSDNVPVEQEITLKDLAAQRDLIVTGPDCGTAIVGGVGLGFAHTLAAGPVGLVAASGTGAQQVLCLLDYAGAGVSAALGVGGRDLSAAIGGHQPALPWPRWTPIRAPA